MITGNYDLIGDVHGHAQVLRRLLRQMDYREEEGFFRHPDRQAIFATATPKQRLSAHSAKGAHSDPTNLQETSP
jgi:hypothetical protein